MTQADPICANAEPEYCDRPGAYALKAIIEAYWRERGQHVMVKLHEASFHAAIRSARIDVRSDMVDGFPRAVILNAIEQRAVA